ncbi:hypothetical protein PT2222_400009 [Paraburkholderia tropica]
MMVRSRSAPNLDALTHSPAHVGPSQPRETSPENRLIIFKNHLHRQRNSMRPYCFTGSRRAAKN